MINSKAKEIIQVIAWIIGITSGIIAIILFFSSSQNEIDLSGNWEMTFKVQNSSLDRFDNNKLEYKYKIFLTQNENAINGNGEKFWEKFKGVETFYNLNQKTPISINGKISEDKLEANIYEKGKRRETSGHIEFEIMDDLKLIKGRFKTTAANSSGTAILEKLD
ncbi:hypothetical protein [Winogradskyella sp.]|uniref:hypothetical protein n=1 Tax=Winogradskyella sp. TaxID=1883156 RepID=UPI003BAA3E24